MWYYWNCNALKVFTYLKQHTALYTSRLLAPFSPSESFVPKSQYVGRDETTAKVILTAIA